MSNAWQRLASCLAHFLHVVLWSSRASPLGHSHHKEGITAMLMNRALPTFIVDSRPQRACVPGSQCLHSTVYSSHLLFAYIVVHSPPPFSKIGPSSMVGGERRSLQNRPPISTAISICRTERVVSAGEASITNAYGCRSGVTPSKSSQRT